MFNPIKEYRCKYCNKLFFKGDLRQATIEIKCKRCSKFNFIKGLNCKFLLCFDEYSSYRKSDESFSLQGAAVNKALDQCSECEAAETCRYYKMIKES